MPHLPATDDPLFAALDAIGSPIFVVEKMADGVFQIVHLNRYFTLYSNLDAATMTSAPVHDIMQPRVAAYVTENYEKVLAQSDPLSSDEVYKFGDRAITWRNTMSRAPLSPAGRERIIGIAVPVDDLKDSNTALVSEVAELRENLKELRTLGRLAAHDLRAPLASVVSLTEIILENFEDRGDGKVEMILACAEVACTSLDGIGALMDRFGADPSVVVKQDEIDLRQMCRGLVSLADPAGKLHITYPEDRVASDATVLNLAVRNLIDNAARFARTRIDVRLSIDAPSGHLVLSVADDGPGFAPGVDPIRQALSGERRADGRGFGIGAVISLLQSRGGLLRTAPPRFASGATVEIVLPGQVIAPEALRRSA